MIIIRSDYSPDAKKKQENDYSMAIRGALCMAGMHGDAVDRYIYAIPADADAYTSKVDKYQGLANEHLKRNLITITNSTLYAY